MTGTIRIAEPMRIEGRRILPIVIYIEGFDADCPPEWRQYTRIEVKRWPPRRVWWGLHLALWIGLRHRVEQIIDATNEAMEAHVATFADAPSLFAERLAICRSGGVWVKWGPHR